MWDRIRILDIIWVKALGYHNDVVFELILASTYAKQCYS